MMRKCWSAVLSVGLMLAAFNGVAQGLPPGVQEVVKLVKAGISEDVVLAQIQHNGAYYNLSTDQIIYLHDQGVTQSEIKALIGSGGSVAPAAPASVPPSPIAPGPAVEAPVVPGPMTPAPGSPSLDSFHAELAGSGTWIDVPGYGACWRPAVEDGNPLWRPYFDQGHWAYTADGWAWQSDYPWGDVTFHYGRWMRNDLGWVWVPGYDWAPAWVCWRKADGFCGWAPLPPTAVYKAGVGLWFGGHVAVNVDFGLAPTAFTFVAYDHFWDHNLHTFLLPPARLEFVFGHSTIMNGYRVDHGRFVIEGLGREHMAALTHHEVKIEVLAHERAREHAIVRREEVRREEIRHDERKDRRGDREKDRDRDR
jgi:hypothetical protein